ncbi:MAG: hypothetical protein LBF76_01870 [Holosporales bacterium]|jgi:cell division protein FtsL|nr:hypothetical protein [Holosporales bacterium]
MFIKDDLVQGARFLQKEIVNYVTITVRRWQRRMKPLHSPEAYRAFLLAFKSFTRMKWTFWVVARRLLLSLFFLGRLSARIGKRGKNHLQNLFLRHLAPYSKINVFVMGFVSMLALTLIMLVVQLRHYEATIFKINEDRQYLLSECGQALRERDQFQISFQRKENAIKILLKKYQEFVTHEGTLKQQLAERDEAIKKLGSEEQALKQQLAERDKKTKASMTTLKQQK